MLKKHETLYNRIIFVYTLSFALYALFGRCALLHAVVEKTVNGPLYNLYAIVGILLLLADVFYYQYYKKVPYKLVFIVFLLIAVISSVLNMKYGIGNNVKTIIWLSIHFGIYLSFGYRIGQEVYKKWLTIYFGISGVMWFVPAVISLYQYVYVKGYAVFLNERNLRQSFCENRLFGVFIDPNLGAFVGLIVMIGMFYLIYITKNKLIKAMCILNIIVQFFYLVLSGSRSALICLVVATIYGTYVGALKILHMKNVKGIKGYLIAVAAPIVALGIIFTCFWAIESTMPMFAKTLSPVTHQVEKELVRKDVEGDVSNNRTTIWSSYIKLTKDKPIFGLSPRNAWNYADKVHPGTYLNLHHYDVHNAYVAVFAGMGIAGFLTLAVMMVLILKGILVRAFQIETLTLPYFIAMEFIICVAVFICFYPGVFFTNGCDTAIFWPAIGFGLQHISSKKKIAGEIK